MASSTCSTTRTPASRRDVGRGDVLDRPGRGERFGGHRVRADRDDAALPGERTLGDELAAERAHLDDRPVVRPAGADRVGEDGHAGETAQRARDVAAVRARGQQDEVAGVDRRRERGGDRRGRGAVVDPSVDLDRGHEVRPAPSRRAAADVPCTTPASSRPPASARLRASVATSVESFVSVPSGATSPTTSTRAIRRASVRRGTRRSGGRPRRRARARPGSPRGPRAAASRRPSSSRRRPRPSRRRGRDPRATASRISFARAAMIPLSDG